MGFSHRPIGLAGPGSPPSKVPAMVAKKGVQGLLGVATGKRWLFQMTRRRTWQVTPRLEVLSQSDEGGERSTRRSCLTASGQRWASTGDGTLCSRPPQFHEGVMGVGVRLDVVFSGTGQ